MYTGKKMGVWNSGDRQNSGRVCHPGCILSGPEDMNLFGRVAKGFFIMRIMVMDSIWHLLLTLEALEGLLPCVTVFVSHRSNAKDCPGMVP